MDGKKRLWLAICAVAAVTYISLYPLYLLIVDNVEIPGHHKRQLVMDCALYLLVGLNAVWYVVGRRNFAEVIVFGGLFGAILKEGLYLLGPKSTPVFLLAVGAVIFAANVIGIVRARGCGAAEPGAGSTAPSAQL